MYWSANARLREAALNGLEPASDLRDAAAAFCENVFLNLPTSLKDDLSAFKSDFASMNRALNLTKGFLKRPIDANCGCRASRFLRETYQQMPATVSLLEHQESRVIRLIMNGIQQSVEPASWLLQLWRGHLPHCKNDTYDPQ
jgi:hypothetical protein